LAVTLARELAARVWVEPRLAVQVQPELLSAARCPERGAYGQCCRPGEPTAARCPAALAPADAPASWRPRRSGQRPPLE
jgi:hypothetical protein